MGGESGVPAVCQEMRRKPPVDTAHCGSAGQLSPSAMNDVCSPATESS